MIRTPAGQPPKPSAGGRPGMLESRRRFSLDQALSSFGDAVAFCAANSRRKAAAHQDTS
jgi:hypothetical protein